MNDGLRVPVADLSTKKLALLLALRFFSAWGDRSSTFAIYLLLVIIFPFTLLPASIYGFCTTASGILLSGFVGSAIDKYRHRRLAVFQLSTFAQKLGAILTYAMCLLFLLDFLGGNHVLSGGKTGAVFLAIVINGIIMKLSNVCINISLEREWVSVIAKGSSRNLTILNTWLRRIDLTCDLLAPLFVAWLSVAASYIFAAAFLCGMAVLSLCVEIPLSNVIYRLFPELKSSGILSLPESELQTDTDMPTNTTPNVNAAPLGCSSYRSWIRCFGPVDLFADFLEFGRLPVFYTTLSIASIYLTVLSFDGTMITFLKNTQHYSDPFIAGQRAVCTVAGLSGTLLFPVVSRKIGLVRTGSWAIWSEFMCLVPVVVSLYVNDGKVGESQWSAGLLFAGMACSRVFLWMFDLAQLQILQESLDAHPKRNRLTSFQYVLQNVFDMAKYALTMGLARPSQFRWAGLASVLAVFMGGTLYSFGYALRVRGHLLPHPQWLSKLKRT